jgi:FAD/FMN-containing dehydrogenase
MNAMGNLRVTTLTGEETTLQPAAVEAFKNKLRGQLLCPGDQNYDEARTIHNGMTDRCPALIARCNGVADVISCVTVARENGLLVSVRGGGHNVAGFSVCDGGLMIDLSQMKSVRVDPVRQTARAEGGATWGDFDHETQAFGLATTGGTARPTGVAGLTLGGGHGFLMRRFGLACDNLLSVDVVTAEGKFITASTGENADLFWGVRGSGWNFGIVTSFEYRLHPLTHVLGGLLVYPMDKARDVFRLCREVYYTAPDELAAFAVLATLPDGTRAAVVPVCYSGPIEKGEEILRPFREFGPPLMDQVGPMPYTALQCLVETMNPRGKRNYWKTSYLRELSDDAINTMVEHYATAPDPLTHVVVYALGGAVSRVGRDETAVDYRHAPYVFLIVGMWSDAAEDERNIRWVRKLWGEMQPLALGVYVNYETDREVERVKAAYGPEQYQRLVALKNKYDPANLFRLNQNIKPTRK